MRRIRIIQRDFREGWLAFEDDVPMWSNPYRDCKDREEVWESGWREAEKWRGGNKCRRAAGSDIVLAAQRLQEQESTKKGLKKPHQRWTLTSVVCAIILFLAFVVGLYICTALFGRLSVDHNS